MVDKHYEVISQDGETLFRDKLNDDQLVYVDNRPAGPADIEKTIRGLYPDLYSITKSGLGTGPGSGRSSSSVHENASLGEIMLAGVEELELNFGS